MFKAKQPSCLLLAALLLLPRLRSAECAAGEKSFAKADFCPPANKAPVPGIRTRLHCASACARSPQCDIFYYRTTAGAGSCFHGDTCATSVDWTAGTCRAYMSVGDFNGVNAWTKSLGMIAFYNFRQPAPGNPLINLADPRRLCLRSSNVTFDNVDGARLYGNRQSYLYMDTPGFEDVVNFGNTYSFYIMLKYPMTTENIFYHRLQQCTSAASPGNAFGKNSQHMTNHAMWSKGSVPHLKSDSPDVLPLLPSPALISAGLAFNLSRVERFYYNGTAYPVAATMNRDVSLDSSNYQCLTIGWSSSSDSQCVNGVIRCYGISARVLSLAEFRFLDSVCLATTYEY